MLPSLAAGEWGGLGSWCRSMGMDMGAQPSILLFLPHAHTGKLGISDLFMSHKKGEHKKMLVG